MRGRRCTCGAHDGLTDTELGIIVGLANGLELEEISRQVHRTVSSVSTYIRDARSKLGAATRAHLVARAFARGVLKVDRDGRVVLAHPVAVAS